MHKSVLLKSGDGDFKLFGNTKPPDVVLLHGHGIIKKIKGVFYDTC